MKVVTGIDLVEIARVKRSMKNEKFMQKVFSQKERELFKDRNNMPQTVACNFAAKEAFLKTFGVGLGAVPLGCIQVLREESGRPYFALLGKAAQLAEGSEITVSLTHTKDYAAAVVVATPQPNKGQG